MKHVLITGGTSGIGYELVQLFSSHCSWSVVTCSRNSDKNKLLDLTSGYINVATVDLGVPQDRKVFLDRFIENNGALDLLILNAAVTGVGQIDGADYSKEYVEEVNVRANKEILDKLLPLLGRARGCVVFISSGIIEENDKDEIVTLYAQTKKEFENYLLEISKTEEAKGIRFVSIRPGMVATRMHARVIKMGVGKLFERTRAAMETGRLRNPGIVAKIIKDCVDFPQKMPGVVCSISDEEYQGYIEK